MRSLTTAAAHGCMGSSLLGPAPLRAAAMLTKPAGMPSWASMHPSAAVASLHGRFSAFQMPERSGVFPSTSVGADADRSGAPEGVNGILVRTRSEERRVGNEVSAGVQ